MTRPPVAPTSIAKLQAWYDAECITARRRGRHAPPGEDVRTLGMRTIAARYVAAHGLDLDAGVLARAWFRAL